MKKIAVVKENSLHEARVALTPEGVKKLTALGYSVVLEQGAGERAGFLDADYTFAGAEIAGSVQELFEHATIVLRVNAGEEKEWKYLPKNSVLLANLKAHTSEPLRTFLCAHPVTAFALEMIPRITRAQSMDILSSQSNLAGYRAVIEAANILPRAFPMMMTPSGTIAPARVLILGAGVAGLQAIATAKRLGAIVSVFDVRAAAKEQVESLGGTFIQVEFEEKGDSTGGYAKEMSEDYKKAQRAKLMDVLKTQDIVITTAQIPMKTAPTLLDEEMVSVMKHGSLIIDLAIESGGNCTLSKMEETVDYNGVKIYAPRNMPSHIAFDASQMLSRNAVHFITNLYKEGVLHMEDAIVKGTCLSHDGKLVHPLFAHVEAHS